MKTNSSPHRRPLSRARFNPLHVIAAAGLLLWGLGIMTSRADQTLLDAPSANSSYYGMYSPSVTAASFTLAASYDVSTIDVVLRTPACNKFHHL
jgi:hypothetical protein